MSIVSLIPVAVGSVAISISSSPPDLLFLPGFLDTTGANRLATLDLRRRFFQLLLLLLLFLFKGDVVIVQYLVFFLGRLQRFLFASLTPRHFLCEFLFVFEKEQRVSKIISVLIKQIKEF